MYRHEQSSLDFINQFVDSVTIRPFFEDLRRIKQAASMFRQLPRQDRLETKQTEAA